MAIDSSTPARARQTVRETLAKLGVAGRLAEDIVLATSELVSNAIEHGGGYDRLEIDYHGAELTTRVYDRNQNRPRLQDTGNTGRERGRGLRLVDAIANAWGHREATGGKYVWARFTLPRAMDPQRPVEGRLPGV